MRKSIFIVGMLLLTTWAGAQTFVPTQPQNRNVLIEEYTGVNCQYCPIGHKATDQALQAFPGRAFAINIHQGMFASQFTTQWGNALANQAGVQGYPTTTLNRHVFEGRNMEINPGQTYSFASQVLDMPSPVNVAATVDIDPVTRMMLVKVEVYYPGNGPGDFNLLNVALLQNNVLGQQAGGSSYYPENMVGGRYRHSHILRDLLTGQWGDTIHHTEAGSFFTKEYAYVVPQRIGDLDVTNMDDLSVVVFVCQDKREVLNVCEAIRVSDKAYMTYGNPGSEECALDFTPYVTVVNPTDKAISNLRFEVDGRSVLSEKSIQPYCTDTVEVLSYSINDMPATYGNYARTCRVSLIGYTTDGTTVNVQDETLDINYANVDIYTTEGPLTLSIAYDVYPEEVTFTLAGLSDCRYYYEGGGSNADANTTVSYTLSPATAGIYRLKLFDNGGDGLDGTVTVTDALGNTLFTRNGQELLVWDSYYFNITTDGVDGPGSTVLGISDKAMTSQDWSIAPNPVSDWLHIDVPELLQTELLNATGHVITRTAEHDVYVGDLPNGIYFLRIVARRTDSQSPDRVEVKKIVKTR